MKLKVVPINLLSLDCVLKTNELLDDRRWCYFNATTACAKYQSIIAALPKMLLDVCSFFLQWYCDDQFLARWLARRHQLDTIVRHRWLLKNDSFFYLQIENYATDEKIDAPNDIFYLQYLLQHTYRA